MKNYAKSAKKKLLCTAANAKRASLARSWKSALTRLQGKTRSLCASALEFLFTAAGVDSGKPLELSVVLVMFSLCASVLLWAILSTLAELAGLA